MRDLFTRAHQIGWDYLAVESSGYCGTDVFGLGLIFGTLLGLWWLA